MRPGRIGLLLPLLALQGCFGTIVTRAQPEGHWVGKYPYTGVAVDCVGVVIGEPIEGMPMRAICLVSIPVDVLVDTALLPIDLVAWPFGIHKNLTPFQ